MKDTTVLQELVKRAVRFRNTPIVDDDFCAIRDEFDSYLAFAEEHLAKPEIMQCAMQDGCMGVQEVEIPTGRR